MEPDRIDAVFDPAAAVSHGAFIATVYALHREFPGNPTPPLQAAPNGFKFIAWVQMKDFIVTSGDWSFYGLLAQSTDHPDRFVLAIRGTSDLEEWWDDLTSIVPAPWSGTGSVGFGFERIYQTLRIVDVSPSAAALAAATAGAGAPSGSFVAQVAAAVHRHGEGSRTALGAAGAAQPTVKTIAVAGHSLGGALATLYVADHARMAAAGSGGDGLEISVLYTFASPRTGDPVFARAFDALPIVSWRIVNELDIVPKLPAIGFEHVDRRQAYNSGFMVRWSPGCWHSLQTYLHLLDPKQPLDPGCAFVSTAKMAKPATASMLAMPAVMPPAPHRDLTVTVSRGDARITIAVDLA